MTDPQQPTQPPVPEDPTPEVPTPEVPTPADPAPEVPAPDPAPEVPAPVDPTPVEPTPVEPTPVEPTPVEPTPVEPTPVEPTPVPVEPDTAPPVVDSFASEPAVPPADAPPADPTPEVPETLADEPPAQPAQPVPTDDPAPAPDPAPDPAARRRSRSWLPVTAVGLAVALLAGATGLLAWQLRQSALAEDARPEAIAAARDAARLLFSYDHASLEDDFAKGLAVTTGEFREEYSRTTTEVVTPVAEQYDAVVVAEVVEASIIDADAGEVTALVFLNQGTTSTRVEGQQVDQSRVRMRLVERDGEWLVEAVEAL